MSLTQIYFDNNNFKYSKGLTQKKHLLKMESKYILFRKLSFCWFMHSTITIQYTIPFI